MKKFLIALIALAPMTLWAQDNTWERIEEDEAQVEAKKVNKDAKYLRGAVPEVDGKVVFSCHIDAPGKSATEIYGIIHGYLDKMTKEKNQLENSKLITEDTQKHIVTGYYEEWLVFKSNAFVLDKTRLYFALEAKCQDGGADITMSHIRYLYEELRKPEKYTAEGWITDKEAVNKKNTKLYPSSGKFRRKTIDRKDFIFNKLMSLLK